MRDFIVLVSGLFAIMFCAIAAAITGHADLAYLTGTIGTMVWLLIVLAYVVLWDSRKRWPGKNALIRLGKVMFFER